LLDACPVDLDVAGVGEELQGHEQDAKEKGQDAADLFEGVAGEKAGDRAEGELAGNGE